MFENKYPYTDFHELNLDWFLAEFKKVHDHVDSLDATVHQFTEFVTNYFNNLDVQEEINKKLDAMAADGSLSALIQPLFDEYKTEIDTEVATQNTLIATNSGKITTLEGRMDTFASLTEGSTTGDAELMDIRTGIDGIEFPTAGDAVRGQVKNLFNNNVKKLQYIENMDHRLLIASGTLQYIASSGYITTNYIPCVPGMRFWFNNYDNTLMNYSFFDVSKTFIESQTTKEYAFAPANAAFVLIGTYGNGYTTMAGFELESIWPEYKKISNNIETMNNTRYASGRFRSDVTTCCSYYLDISDYDNLLIYNYDVSTPVIAFFDSSFTYISQAAIYPIANINWNDIARPATAKYAVITGVNGTSVSEKIKLMAYEGTIEIGSGKRYATILEALKNEIAAKNFIVYPGTYDIEAEYETVYGNSFWSSYSGYTGSFDYFLRGLNLFPGQSIKFMPGANVIFNYSGSNTAVAQYFSVFNLTYNNVLDGAYVNFGNGITRYVVHDDAAAKPGVNQIINCIFDGTSGNGPAIGGGCGLHNRYILNNDVFINNTGVDIMYHNNLNAGVENNVTVSNCYGSNNIVFLYCGASTIVSKFVVNNSKFNDVLVSPHPNAQHDHVNIELIEYCNDLNQ